MTKKQMDIVLWRPSARVRLRQITKTTESPDGAKSLRPDFLAQNYQQEFLHANSVNNNNLGPIFSWNSAPRRRMKATDRPITGKIGQNKKFAQNKRKPTPKIYIYTVKNSNFQFAIQNLQSKITKLFTFTPANQPSWFIFVNYFDVIQYYIHIS